MRRILFVILAAAVLLMQVSLLPGLRPLGVVPNLALVFVVLVGLESTSSTAVLLGVVMGVALDVASGANLGMWTGILVLAALVTGLLHRGGVETGGPIVPVVMVAIGTVLMAVMVLSGVVNAVSSWPVGTLIGRVMCELVLNLGLIFVVRPAVRQVVPRTAPDVVVMG